MLERVWGYNRRQMTLPQGFCVFVGVPVLCMGPSASYTVQFKTCKIAYVYSYGFENCLAICGCHSTRPTCQLHVWFLDRQTQLMLGVSVCKRVNPSQTAWWLDVIYSAEGIPCRAGILTVTSYPRQMFPWKSWSHSCKSPSKHIE